MGCILISAGLLYFYGMSIYCSVLRGYFDMKVTEFSENTKVDRVTAPWESELGKDDFVSYMPSYTGGGYRDKFEECTFKNDTVGDMTYYLYNPIDNGAKPDVKYPLLLFIHGATNALDGRICVSHCGGEMFASPQYQSEMGGGAFILVPLANEKRDAEGNLVDSWSEKYLQPLAEMLIKVKNEFADNISKVAVLGGSYGGGMSWALAEYAPELFDGCMPVSAGYIPDDKGLKRIEQAGIKVITMHGRHDELIGFDEAVRDRIPALLAMDNVICYFPEWVRNGDYGVASLNFGFEMGQHCLIIQVQANLIYNDGKPYIDELPNGVTGWIASL